MGDQKNTQIKAKMTSYLSLSWVRNMIIFVAFVLHKIVVVQLYFMRASFRLQQYQQINNKSTTKLSFFELLGVFWTCSSMQK